MTDVMQAITSTSTASWGFNNLDMDAEPPMKIETIETEDNDVIMKDGDGGVDDSDSDIEIISSSVVNPNRAPQYGRPDTFRRSPPRASDSRSGERNGRKRADSSIDLSGDESPPKRSKTRANGNARPTPTSAARSGASRPPSQQARSPSKSSHPNHGPDHSKRPMPGGESDRFRSSASKARPSNAISSEKRRTSDYSTPASAAAIYPPGSKYGSTSSIRLQPLSRRTPPIPSATPVSSNNATNMSKTPKLGGTLDHTTPSTFGRSLLNKSYNYLSSAATLLKPSSSSSPQPQHRSNSRLGMPFEEDDSDEELFGKESSPDTESTAGALTPKHEQSEPEFDNIVVAAQPPLSEQTVSDRPANTDKSAHKAPSSSRGPSHVDKIRHDSRQYSSTRKFPDTSKVLPAGDNEREVAITKSKHSSSAFPTFESHSRPLESEVRTQRTTNGEFGLGSSFLGKRRDDRTLAGSRPRDIPRNMSLDDDEKRVREEKSRKMQDDFMAKIRSAADPRTRGEVVESRSGLADSTTPITIPQKPIDDPEVRRRREEAANARKQADLRREVEASQRAREKAEAERERYERQQQMLQARREQARQKQQQASEEERIFAERSAAMSKLSQVKPLPPKPKKSVDDSASVGGLLATVSARKETVPLHRVDEPGKGLTSSLDYGEDPGKETATSRGWSQKENVEPTPTSVPASQLAALRELRIREKNERNERMRAAERKEEQKKLAAEKEEERRRLREQRDAALSQDIGAPPVLKGPVSLNSIAGQRLLSESKTVPRKLGQGPQPDIKSPQRNRDRKLGELREDDVQVLQWKDTMGMKWPEVLQLYNRKYNRSWSEGTLKNRYFQVRKAIGLAEISDDQWDNLTAGCEETRLEVDRMINGDAFQMGQISPMRPRDEAEASAVRHGPTIHLQSKAVHWDPSIASAQSPPLQTPREQEDPYDRQSKGGKTMNAEAFRYFLEHIAEEFTKNEEDMEDRAAREPSPFDPDDYTPFMYQVQRRELDQDAIDAGDDIDEEAWTTCGDTYGFDTAHEANLATYQELFTNREGALSRADLSKGRVHSTEIIEGMEFHELKGKNGGGVRQVRVARSLRSLGKGSMPRNKVGWTPRTAFVVKQRTIVDSKSPPAAPEKDRKEDAEKADDQAVDPELFGEEVIPETLPAPEPHPISTRTSDTKVLEGIYTILELANRAAVKEFVKATFKPKSANLGLRGFEIQEEEERLLKDLDEDDFFYEKAEADFKLDEGQGGEGMLEIWVEEGELRGPRNLD